MKYWNYYPFEGKILVKNGPNQERLAMFLRVVLCRPAFYILSSSSSHRLPKLKISGVCDSFVYTGNCMAKSPFIKKVV